MRKLTKEQKEIANEIFSRFFVILEWHTNMDCVASWEEAEKIRKEFSPDSSPFTNEKEDSSEFKYSQ